MLLEFCLTKHFDLIILVIIPEDFLVFFDGKAQSQGSFESQIAAICDDIAYNNNDLDDGLHAGLFEIDELAKGAPNLLIIL